jgi:hypothetical protein
MPLPLLRAYGRMIARLQAEEALAVVTATALGSGSLEKSEARRIQAAWRKAAEGPHVRPQLSPEQRNIMLRSAGIGVRVVPVKVPVPVQAV